MSSVWIALLRECEERLRVRRGRAEFEESDPRIALSASDI